MLLAKEGVPEEGELVLCTVTNVQHHSVFVRLEEYGKGGMIHISEISPGRIRNIRDFVKEGKIIVCKVLRVNMERGHIDLSLRRVSDNQRRIKVNQVKQEQKAEKLIEVVAKELKRDVKEVYDEVSKPIFQKYDSIFACFTDLINGNCKLEEVGIPKKTAEAMTKVVEQRLKPQEVVFSGKLKMQSYAPDGVEIVRNAFKKLIDAGAEVKYLAAGDYRVSVKAPDYKTAEKLFKTASSAAVEYVKKEEGTAEVIMP
ncbi:translation initiation factor IF-2 subunit alpha [Candidatus Woesearchaeota archaeon]|nr:translation initiation factor IF-2 subunit alpha [Candidatus Woesearchaeota archaeon]